MEIEKEIEEIKEGQKEILGFLSEICKITGWEGGDPMKRKMLQLKREIDKALSKQKR